VVELKPKVLKTLSWLALLTVLAAITAGVKVNWLLTSVSSAVLLVFILLLEFEERHCDSRMVALVGVLVALTVASRQMLHGVEFTPVFFLVILSGYVYGFTTGFTVGALTMFTSNLFLGHGPWTPFQMFGVGFIGAFAAYIPHVRRYEMHLLVAYSILSAYMYSVFMDATFWVSFIPAHSLNSLIAILGAGVVAATARAAGNLFFMSLMGPALLKVLKRFRIRLTYVRTT
jgi:energy-coupling factor transport system substrate-specific component